jgi:hypothetical protein
MKEKTVDKDALLRLIAESAYNIGYAAKKHLATYDLVEKVPGWIGLVSLAVGIFALFMPDLAKNPVAATVIMLGVASITINFYTADKDQYAQVGSELTSKFHELRTLYSQVKLHPDTANLTSFINEHDRIQKDSLELGIAKQIFLSDWYAHYKFFWQMQTDWLDEQLHFRLVRDKLPLGFTLLVVGAVVWGTGSLVPDFLDHLKTLCQKP